jgi:hypothetical protein
LKEVLEKAQDYVFNYGRPFEKELLDFHNNQGSKEAVISALEAYKNDDGGFGKALEADFRAQESSVLCTTFAMDILIDIGVTADHPVIRSAATYLTTNYHEDLKSWRLIPELPENYSHAPWWNQNKLAEVFNNFLENPRVKILGYMFEYPILFANDLRTKLLELVLNYLQNRSVEISIDSIDCYLLLLDSKNLPTEVKATLFSRLCEMILASVEEDQEKWDLYAMKPLDLIKQKDSPFIKIMPDLVQQNVEYYIKTQKDDGSWDPPWLWDNGDDQGWQQAKIDWTGFVTLDRLKKLEWFA